MKIEIIYRDAVVSQLEHTGNYSRIPVRIPGHNGIMQIRFAIPI